jgi:hypothetical protein
MRAMSLLILSVMLTGCVHTTVQITKDSEGAAEESDDSSGSPDLDLDLPKMKR